MEVRAAAVLTRLRSFQTVPGVPLGSVPTQLCFLNIEPVSCANRGKVRAGNSGIMYHHCLHTAQQETNQTLQVLLPIPSKPCPGCSDCTWCNPWWCSACVRWSAPCSPQTVSEWSSGSGHQSPGRWQPWPHPGSGSWFCAGELWPGTPAASGQHCKHREPSVPHCSQPLCSAAHLLTQTPWNILQAACSAPQLMPAAAGSGSVTAWPCAGRATKCAFYHCDKSQAS